MPLTYRTDQDRRVHCIVQTRTDQNKPFQFLFPARGPTYLKFVFLFPGDWGHLGFLHLHLNSLFLLEDPPWHESSYDKVNAQVMNVPIIIFSPGISLWAREEEMWPTGRWTSTAPMLTTPSSTLSASVTPGSPLRSLSGVLSVYHFKLSAAQVHIYSISYATRP